MEWLYPQPFGNEEIADVHFEPQKTVGRSYALFVHRVSECCGSCAANKTDVEATPANFFPAPIWATRARHFSTQPTIHELACLVVKKCLSDRPKETSSGLPAGQPAGQRDLSRSRYNPGNRNRFLATSSNPSCACLFRRS